MKDFRLFVKAWAFDVIRQSKVESESGGYENFWCLYQSTEEDWLGHQEIEEVYLTHPVPGQEPDLVEAMRTWNYERKGLNPDSHIEINYEGVRVNVKKARGEVVSRAIASGAGIDVDLARERFANLSPSDQNNFLAMWLEKKYLEKRQKELKKTIDSSSASRIQQDGAIAMFMVIDDDINSLDMNMKDMLRRAER